MSRTIRFMERIRYKFDFKALISDRHPFKEIDRALIKLVIIRKRPLKQCLSFKIKQKETTTILPLFSFMFKMYKLKLRNYNLTKKESKEDEIFIMH